MMELTHLKEAYFLSCGNLHKWKGYALLNPLPDVVEHENPIGVAQFGERLLDARVST